MAGRLDPSTWLDGVAAPGATSAAAVGLRARAAGSLAAVELKEYWKYTRIDGFLEQMTDACPSEPVLTGIDQPGLSLVRQHGTTLQREIADRTGAGRFPLADVALLITGDVLVLRVAGAVDAPVEITFSEGIHLPVLIELQAGARLTVIERCLADDFSNHCLYLRLAEDAVLSHARIATSSAACHWSLTEAMLASRSQYNVWQYFRGGRRRRAETHIVLDGHEAEAHLLGATVVDGDTHLDQQLIVEHRAPGASSRQKMHCIGAGKGSTVFNGRIHIHPNTPGSDASLSNRNLTLDPQAEISTKPELEIYTDDVRCAHGATVGQLSEESLFYLRSRGVGLEDARRMLCRAFVTECIDGPLAEEAASALLGALSEEPAS